MTSEQEYRQFALDVIHDLATHAETTPGLEETRGTSMVRRFRALQERTEQMSGTLRAIDRVVLFASKRARQSRRIRLVQADRFLAGRS